MSEPEYIWVRSEDPRQTLEHLDTACRQIGGEPCHASFVWHLRQALLNAEHRDS